MKQRRFEDPSLEKDAIIAYLNGILVRFNDSLNACTVQLGELMKDHIEDEDNGELLDLDLPN
jgi:hypothetical protein